MLKVKLRNLLTFVGLFGLCISAFGQLKINAHNSWGYNFVDLEEATGTPEFSKKLPVDQRQLVDWDRFFYNGEVQVLFSINDNLDAGIAVGFNRLYYWEERYRNLFDTRFQFDYGTIWTFEVSALANYYFDQWFVQGALGLHNFQGEGAQTAGLSGGVGREMAITDKFSIPIIIKHDLVFGDGLTHGLNAGLGVQYEF
jgi:hypothetical protein